MLKTASVSKFSTLLHDGEVIRIGRFNASAQHPDFADTGPMTCPTIVFPRNSVYIAYEGHQPFLSNPASINFYNEHQGYERLKFDEQGDVCDWFEFDSQVINEALSEIGALTCESSGFPFHQIPTHRALYLKQRLIVNQLEANVISGDQTDELALLLLDEILSYALSLTKKSCTKTNIRQHQELVASAVAMLSNDYCNTSGVEDLAKKLGVSRFHLSRVFKEVTGKSIHQYKLDLRLSQSLTELVEFNNITEIALNLGFSSHAHFSDMFVKRFGLSPCEYRKTGYVKKLF